MKRILTLFVTLTSALFLASCDSDPEVIQVNSISLNETSLTIDVNETYQLNAFFDPIDASDKTVTWKSSNPTVAAIDSFGLITAISEGSSTITATSVSNPSATANCEVTVLSSSSWTVLIYMCGSDLESEDGYYLATADIKEICGVTGQPEDVNIVIQTGGAKKWSTFYHISNQINQRYHVANKTLVKDMDLTDLNMGAASTLQGFIEYGLTTYPADKTGLILWNHGSGMQGVCFDEKHRDDCLMGSEVIEAVSGAFTSTSRNNKLEFIGYDACLMQVQDLAEKNSPYFKYMVASQESENGEGWVYNNWIDDLYAKKSTKDILISLCDETITYYGSRNNDQTLSILDLSMANAYMIAWENMANALKNKLTTGNRSSFNTLVKSVKYYGLEDYLYIGLFDAKDFINKLASNQTFNPGSSYTSGVLDAFSNLVIYDKKGSAAGNSNGLSMFWAVSRQTYASEYYTSEETNFSNWRYIVEIFGY